MGDVLNTESPKGETPRERGIRAAFNDGISDALAALRGSRIAAKNLGDGLRAEAVAKAMRDLEALFFA